MSIFGKIEMWWLDVWYPDTGTDDKPLRNFTVNLGFGAPCLTVGIWMGVKFFIDLLHGELILGSFPTIYEPIRFITAIGLAFLFVCGLPAPFIVLGITGVIGGFRSLHRTLVFRANQIKRLEAENQEKAEMIVDQTNMLEDMASSIEYQAQQVEFYKQRITVLEESTQQLKLLS